MSYIQPLKQIPAKSEIAEYVNQFKALDNLSPIEKYANLKFLEEFVKQALKELKDPAKDDFIQMFNGATQMDFAGVTVQLKNMSKSNTLKDPNYIYSDKVYNYSNDIEQLEQKVKDMRDILKGMKTMEINDGTAKKEELFEEPKELKDDFQLTITLRK